MASQHGRPARGDARGGTEVLERRDRGQRTFADYMELGHKIYTLDRSIWALQNGTDMEVFPDYVYDKPSVGHD